MWMEKLLPINVTGGDSGSLSVCWLSEALVCGNACVFFWNEEQSWMWSVGRGLDPTWYVAHCAYGGRGRRMVGVYYMCECVCVSFKSQMRDCFIVWYLLKKHFCVTAPLLIITHRLKQYGLIFYRIKDVICYYCVLKCLNPAILLLYILNCYTKCFHDVQTQRSQKFTSVLH